MKIPQLKDIKVGRKIMGTVLTALALMIGAAAFGILKLRTVGRELEEIAHADIPLSSAIARFQAYELEQIAEYERALRFGDKLAQGSHERARFDAAVATLEVLYSKSKSALADANAICEAALAKPGLSAATKAEFASVKQVLAEVAENYRIFNADIDEAMALAREGRLAELAETIEKGEGHAIAQAQRLEHLANEVGEFTQASANEAQEAESAAVSFMAICTVAALVTGIVLALWVSRSIHRPLGRAAAVIKRVAEGDLTLTFEYDAKDEIGEICIATNSMVSNLRATVTTLSSSSESLAGSAVNLSAVSTQVSSSAEETASQATVVASASEQISQSVSTVATASEEMSSSIREIAAQTSEAAHTASQATRVLEETNAKIGKLGVSSNEIGEVIKVITSIADQTNLLALNATIEAARAGEAGKGFAVVATEVKELASQTRQATEEIRNKIQTIQRDSDGAIVAMQEIATVMKKINDVQGVIASAVEEQASTMTDISKNSAEASQGSSDIARNILSVSQAAAEATDAAARSARAAQELNDLSAELRQIVGRFKVESDRPHGQGKPGASRVEPVSEASSAKRRSTTPSRKALIPV